MISSFATRDCHVRRNGEADADVARLAAVGTRASAGDRGVDAYDGTVEIDKRTTRVAWVDRSVGLHREIDRVIVVARTDRASGVGHDAAGYRLREPERRACGDDGLADLKLAGLRERGWVQIA